MKMNSRYRKYWWTILFPIGVILTNTAPILSPALEKVYSNHIFRAVNQVISLITGIIPLSVAELLVIGLLLYFLWALIRTMRKIILQPRQFIRILLKSTGSILIYVSIIYFCFIVLWGLNYHRLPFSEIAGLDAKPASFEELKVLCQDLIARTNRLRLQVKEDSKGIMYLPDGIGDAMNRASKGYKAASEFQPELGGQYGRPKGVLLSTAMSYAGISGIYFPFTAEANINTRIPHSLIPSTTCHEMAHQRGFAREDEANYIAYLVCSVHPDPDFQYSGTLLALIHAMNALARQSPSEYLSLRQHYSEGVHRDLANINNFWKHHEGPVEKASSKLNNAYLKSNKQDEGIKSYGRMVDLLIAEYRAKMSK